jgi:hypothetical protein
MQAVRLLEVSQGLWLVVSDVPLNRYGENAINRKLSDIDWVSRAAVAHEKVVESFIGVTALLPMKLFTIFTSDKRALDHVRRDRPHIDALAKKVANHHEWGVRVMLGPTARPKERRTVTQKARESSSGLNYLARKKAQRDTAAELATHASETVASVYERLAARSGLARRRAASELPIQGGPLLLDAAFLVAKSHSKTFRSLVARESRSLSRHGYGVTLTGPWPPYSFIQD